MAERSSVGVKRQDMVDCPAFAKGQSEQKRAAFVQCLLERSYATAIPFR